MMSCRSILGLLACGSLFAGSAFASFCTTQSRGIYFQGDAYEVDAATNLALNACQQSPVTDNSECSRNLACGYDIRRPYPSGRVSCSTSSKRIGFQSTGDANSINSVLQQALQSCQQNPATDNSECSSQLRCADSSEADLPYPSGRVRCTTQSHNIPFEMRGDASEVTQISRQVLTQCQQNPTTDNSECSNELSCRNDGYGEPEHGPDYPEHGGHHHPLPDMAVCTTSSHNINFERSGSREQIDELTSQVLNECNRNPVTDNSECSQNLSCR